MLNNIVFTILSRFIALLLGMLSLMISAKYYGPEGRGLLVGVTTIASMMATVGGMSVGRVLIFEINRLKLYPADFFRSHLYSILLLTAFLSFLTYSGAIFLYLVRSDFYGKIGSMYYIVGFIAIPTLIWSGKSVYIFSALNKMKAQNIIGLVIQGIFVLVASFFVIVYGVGLIWFLLMITLCNIFTSFLEIFYLIKYLFPESRVDPKEILQLIKSGCKIHFDTIGGIIITSANILILNYYLNTRDVGIYQLALQLVSIIIIIPTVVGLVFNHDIAVMGHDPALLKHSRYFLYVLIFVSFLSIISYVLIPHAILIFASTRFEESIPIFRLLLLSVIANSFSILIGPQWTSRGFFKLLSFLTIFLGVCGFFLSIYLIKRFHIAGAAYSTIILYYMAMTANLIFYVYHRNKIKRENLPLSETPT